jgi:hypothetical protein
MPVGEFQFEHFRLVAFAYQNAGVGHWSPHPP